MRWVASAKVVRVIDGDTFHAELDIGWGIMLRPRGGDNGGLGTVRVLMPGGGPFDAPDRETPYRQRLATEAAQRLLWPGIVVPIISHRLDDFGRTLASVSLPDGRDFGQVMTALGHVK